MGKVEECGEGATKFQKGQRVVAAPWPTLKGHGTWQQYVVVDENVLQAVPDGVSDEAAAVFYINPVTAIGFFEAR